MDCQSHYDLLIPSWWSAAVATEGLSLSWPNVSSIGIFKILTLYGQLLTRLININPTSHCLVSYLRRETDRSESLARICRIRKISVEASIQ
jgi:hypothetical protein